MHQFELPGSLFFLPEIYKIPVMPISLLDKRGHKLIERIPYLVREEKNYDHKNVIFGVHFDHK